MRRNSLRANSLLIAAALILLSFSDYRKMGDDFLPARGKIRLAVILVSFPGLAPKASKDEVNRMIFSRGEIPSGSVADYYWEVSGGKVELTGEVFGWFEAAQSEEYYANSHFGHQPGTYPRNAAGLVVEALELADQAGLDFSRYDNSGDGAVDSLVVLFAGPGGHIGNNLARLWPWESYLSADGTRPVLKDGVKIDRYLTVSERAPGGELNFIPILCHELGHLFGLPDLFDWDNGSVGIGKFGLMGYGVFGGDKAFWPEAWTRAYLGWSEPRELTAPGKYELKPAETGGEIFRLNTSRPGEYFLLENRSPLGSDAGLFGKGLVIYHVDERVMTRDDFQCIGYCPDNHYLVAVEQADGLNQLETKKNEGDAADFFPGANRVTDWSDITGQGSNYLAGAHTRLWDGELTGIAMSGIKLQDDAVIFKLKLGEPQSLDPFVPALRLFDYQVVDLGNHDGILDPGEKFELVPVISNQGAKAKKIWVDVKTPDLTVEKIELTPKDPIRPGEKIELSPGFLLKVPESWPKAQEVPVEIVLNSKTEKFSKIEKINLVVGKPEILLVMDDDGMGLKRYYEPPLKDAGAVFYTLEIKDALPSAEFLGRFSTVIWATGIRGADKNPSLDQPRQALLSALIDRGQNLILISPGLKLEEANPLAAKLGLLKAEPGMGIKAVKDEKVPPQSLLLNWFYFPAANPAAIITPGLDAQVLYRNLLGDPIAISFRPAAAGDQPADPRPMTTVICFPLEALKENQARDLFKELLGQS